MECMEEGYLAKIVLGDGSTGIKVGEVLANKACELVIHTYFLVYQIMNLFELFLSSSSFSHFLMTDDSIV